MDTFEKLKVFHEGLLPLAGTLRFNKRDPVDLHRVALYGTLLEFTGCMIQLVQHNGCIGVPLLFRAFLEAAVELRNLTRDAGYIDHMNASYLDQWVNVLKEAKEGTNPYLASIGSLPDLDTQIADQEKQVQELKARGKRPLKVAERFERAGMVKEYRSLYNFLSCDSHSNIRALISRHNAIKLLRNFYKQHYSAVMRFKDHLPWYKRSCFTKRWYQYCCYDKESGCETFSDYEPRPNEEEVTKRRLALSRIRRLLRFARV